MKPYLEIKNLLFPLNRRVIFIGFKNEFTYIADKGEISINLQKKNKIETNTTYHPEENSHDYLELFEIYEKLVAYYYVRQASRVGISQLPVRLFRGGEGNIAISCR